MSKQRNAVELIDDCLAGNKMVCSVEHNSCLLPPLAARAIYADKSAKVLVHQAESFVAYFCAFLQRHQMRAQCGELQELEVSCKVQTDANRGPFVPVLLLPPWQTSNDCA